MINKIILASKSGVRKQILNKNGIDCEVLPANIDEDQIKDMAKRRNISVDQLKKWLASNLR